MLSFNPSKKDGVCDYCGGELTIRKDDNAETVKSRLEAYHSQNSTTNWFYKKMGVFMELDGTKRCIRSYKRYDKRSFINNSSIKTNYF